MWIFHKVVIKVNPPHSPMISNFKSSVLAAACLLWAPAIVVCANAASGTWDGTRVNSSGTWRTGTNWIGGVIASGQSSTANITFAASATSGRTITLTQDETIGVLNLASFAGAASVASPGGFGLIMDNGASQAVISNTAGTGNAITVPLYLTASGLKIMTTGTSNTFVVSGAISSLASSGTQTLTLSHSGGGSIFTASGNISDGLEGGTIALMIDREGPNYTGGPIALTGANSFTGGITVRRGSVSGGAANFGGNAIQLGDSLSGTSAVTVSFVNGTSANNVTVGAGGTGAATIGTGVGSLVTGNIILERNAGGSLAISGTSHISGNISGVGSLFFELGSNGVSSMTLSGSNTFSGGLRTGDDYIAYGIGSTHAVGSGTWTIAQGSNSTFNNAHGIATSIDNTSGSAMTMAANVDQVWYNFSFLGSNDLNLGTGRVALGGIRASSAIVNVQDKKLTVGGEMYGAKSFGNMGSGTMVLQGLSTYTGYTAVGGLMEVGVLRNGGVASNIGSGSNAASNLILNRGTLRFTGTGADTDRLFTIGNGGATIENNGTGELNFTNIGQNVSTDTVSINLLASPATFGNGANIIILSNAGGANTANLAVGMTMSGANIADGTIITAILDGGRIQISNPTTGVSTQSAYTFGALDRTLTLSGSNGGNNSIAGGLVDSASKTLGLTKAGTGKWVLNGTNTYTGATTVNAGTLVIGQTGRISNSSAVTINGGGNFAYNSSEARTGAITLAGNGVSRAILSGTGVINVAVVLDNIGDTLSPGNSPGVRAFGVSQSWESFTYEWETNNFTGSLAGTDFDQIAITGGLTLTGGDGDYVLDLISLTALNVRGDVGNFAEGEFSWNILTTTTGITGFDANNWTILTSNFTSNPAWEGMWSLSQSGNNLVLSYSAVPEPGTYAMVLGGLGLLALAHRRRFKK